MFRSLVPSFLVCLASAVSAQMIVEEDTFRPFGYTQNSGEYFGRGVAIDGDLLAVGAVGHSGSVFFSGAVWVYERAPGGSWQFLQKLEASDAATDSRFGRAVAIDGDRIVVGAYGATNYRGAAYVFERQLAGNFLEVARLQPAELYGNSEFGFAVDISGDHVVVGAPKFDGFTPPYLSDQGGAWFFERKPSGAWLESHRLGDLERSRWAALGESVSIDGSVAAVGMPDPINGAGRAIVLGLDANGAWGTTDTIYGVRDTQLDYCGGAVSVKGDRLAIGARNRWVGMVFAGEVYLYERSALGPYQHVQTLRRTVQGGFFGSFLDLDDDRLLVRSEYVGGVEGGYVFEPDASGTWDEVGVLVPQNVSGDEAYGQAMALDGDSAVVGGMLRNRVHTFELGGLTSDLNELSLTNGGFQHLSLRAGVDHANEPFLFLGTTAGTSPGVFVPALGETVPINPNGYTNAFLASGGAGLMSPIVGTLDADGRATVTVSVPGGLSASLAGTTLHHAYVTASGGALSFVSNAAALTANP